MNGALTVASLFVSDGLLASTRYRRAELQRPPYRAQQLEHGLYRTPMVVLIGPNTMGGAELIAAALQDHRRAVIVGQRTRGKNVVMYCRFRSPPAPSRVSSSKASAVPEDFGEMPRNRARQRTGCPGTIGAWKCMSCSPAKRGTVGGRPSGIARANTARVAARTGTVANMGEAISPDTNRRSDSFVAFAYAIA